MSVKQLLTGLMAAVLLAACTDNDRRAPGPPPGAVFLDCRVSGEEGKEAVTCLAQVREGGREGRPLELPPPASVALDGVPLPGDSGGISGTFYEIMVPAEDFGGLHRLVFNDPAGKSHETIFSWAPFRMEELPGPLRREGYRLPLEGWTRGKKIRLMLVDTSFTTDDVNRLAPVENGVLVLQPEWMQNLAPGPVMMELVREETHLLQAEGRTIGRLVISYSLRREFELED